MPYIHSVYNEIAKRSERRLDIEILLSTRMSAERKMSGSGDVERLEKIAAGMEADQKSDKSSQQGEAENNSAVAQREAQWGEWKDIEEDQDKPPSESNFTSSRPPSPPDSGVRYRRLSIAPCPLRLTPFYPPVNFSCVERGTIFRSGFPSNRNVPFLQGLSIKTIITLDNHDYFENEELYNEIPKYVRENGIKHVSIPVKGNKKRTGSAATLDSICEVLCYAMNPKSYPLYIHCNHGRHRSGCVVACLRKIQRWPLDEVLREYETYASPKPRAEDIEFITNFDPAIVYEFAKSRGMLESWPREKRADSAVDIWDLAAALPVHGSQSAYTSSESGSEDGLFMPRPSDRPIPTKASTPEPPKTDSVVSQMADVTLKEVVDEEDLPPSQQVTPRAGTKAPLALATTTNSDSSPKACSKSS